LEPIVTTEIKPTIYEKSGLITETFVQNQGLLNQNPEVRMSTDKMNQGYGAALNTNQ
jgi:hypothetical protein